MISLTHGVMPSREEFNVAFKRITRPAGYEILLSRSDSKAVEDFDLGDGVWDCDHLWFALHQINDSEPGDFIDCEQYDRAIALVSTILQTLEFEWI